jgi:uncharacterized membrane protein
MKKIKSGHPTSNNSDNESNWKLGFFYYNKNDKRMLVPKRFSAMGVTINFAHPVVVIFFILFLIVALLPVISSLRGI